MKFSETLKNLRLDRNLTQAELADKLSVSRSSIGMYEQGKREPDFETLELIADFFNVSISSLIDAVPTDNTPSGNSFRLISIFQSLTPENQKDVLDFCEYKYLSQISSRKESV